MDSNTELLVKLLEAQTAHFNQRFDTIQQTVNGTNARLDTLNGRMRKAETSIVRLKVIVGAALFVVGATISAIIKRLVGAA